MLWGPKRGLAADSPAERDAISALAGEVDVVHLTSGHRADDARVFRKECVSLARAGYRVALVVPENGTLRRRVDVFEIIPVPYHAGRPGRMLASAISVGVTALRCRASVYHFHDPDLIPTGLVLRSLGKKVIYDAHEDVPRDILIKNWIPHYLRRPVSLMAAGVEWSLGRALSGIVAATPIIAHRFPQSRTALVRNFADLSEFSVTKASPGSLRQAVAYIGSVTAERCAFEMVEAIARIERFPDLRLIIAGTIESDSLNAQLTKAEGWHRVDYLGFQSRQGVASNFNGGKSGAGYLSPRTIVYRISASEDVRIYGRWLTSYCCGFSEISGDYRRKPLRYLRTTAGSSRHRYRNRMDLGSPAGGARNGSPWPQPGTRYVQLGGPGEITAAVVPTCSLVA